MFGIMTVFAVIYLAYKLISEACEKPKSKYYHKDWDAYWKDVNEGKMTQMEIIKKERRGGYMTEEPPPTPWYQLPRDTVVDVERYELDKKRWGEEMAESWRQSGAYLTKQKSGW